MPIASVFLFFSSLVFAQSAVNQEKIRLTIKNHLGEVRRCYNDGLKKTPDVTIITKNDPVTKSLNQ